MDELDVVRSRLTPLFCVQIDTVMNTRSSSSTTTSSRNEINRSLERINAISQEQEQVPKQNNHNGSHMSNPPKTDNFKLYKYFIKCDPLEFRGSLNLMVSERWISRLEKIFDVLCCSDEERFLLAVFMLRGDADDWWTSELDGHPPTWAGFLERFNNKYFP